MISEELAALRALPGNLVFLARIPETLWRRIGVHEVGDTAGQCLAFTQVRGGKVGNGPADVADWRIQLQYVRLAETRIWVASCPGLRSERRRRALR